MTSFSSSVDDPERHFLGNLLDDDSLCSNRTNKSSSTEPANNNVLLSTSSTIPQASAISNVGFFKEDMSLFWPEPPPPYSPPKSPSVAWNDTSISNTQEIDDSSLADFLRAGLKRNPKPFREQDYVFDNDVSFLRRISQKDSFLPPTQIHHHHHNLHHHTHMHNVVENHHHYPIMPMPPPPGFADVIPKPAVKTPSPLKAIGNERSEGLQKSPHSAPVVHKMPFSYRDVAARPEPNSLGMSSVIQDGKSHSPVSEPEYVAARKDQKSASTDCLSLGEENSKKQLNEFQKIARKKGKEKKVGKDIPSPSLLEDKEKMPIGNNYQLLNDLPASRELSVEAAIADDDGVLDEMDAAACRPKRPGNNNERRIKSLTAVPIKRRNFRKKTEWPVWATALMSLCSLVASKLSALFVFLMTLVVDVCSDSMDVINFGFCCLVNAVVERIKFSVNYVLMSIYCRIGWIRQMRSSSLFSGATDFPVVWGCAEYMPVPAAAEDILHRIVHLEYVDAYSILGLPADCSDDEIQKSFHRLNSVVEKCQGGGAVEALLLLSKAADLLSTPELRIAYQPTKDVLTSNDHHALNNLWEVVCRLRKDAKLTLFCSCGKRHAKIPMADLKASEARTCRKCRAYHSVKENDVWVESILFGIVWQYLTYMDGTFYDISEWATCKANSHHLLRPNCHTVQYRFDCNTSDAKEHPDELVLVSKEVRPGVSAAAVRPLEREEDRSRRAANRRQKRR